MNRTSEKEYQNQISDLNRLLLDFKDQINAIGNERDKWQKIATDLAEKCFLHGVMPSLPELNFRKMRKAKGLTLRKVEETTGISNAYLSQLENGKIKSPGYDTVKVLYELYGNEA